MHETGNVEITSELVASHGLTPEEFERVCESLGRTPNLTELGIFSVMWSEHCSYKSSRTHLKNLPTEGPQVIQGPGENAGVVDIGDGQAAVFKIESHNHPSFIEPYQGAATGVGGIIRDIFTMGARPIAVMDALHFGPLVRTRNQYTMEGVVAGVGGYGNCMGIPTVGGEVIFQEHYGNNPLVNVYCLGVAPRESIFYGKASGVGNPVIYVGAKTGRDGIHGVTMASEQFEEGEDSKRPTVQVGDPFLEKLLLEACLEAMGSGTIVGIQDMGGAGLTCSSCEMGGRADRGVEIHLDRVPQREPGMTPYELMLSESQERMLLVCRKGREEEVKKIFSKWDLDAVVIGEVKDHGKLVVYDRGTRVAEIPNRALTDEAPAYTRPTRRPAYLESLTDWRESVFPEPEDYNELLRNMAASPQLCSRRWVYRQYDYQVRTNTVAGPGSDAAVLRLKQGKGALAMSLDGNPFFCYLDPRQGAQHAVAEGCRNLICTGALPLAATNCLNFANPENPEIMWQFAEAVSGIGEACTIFGTPITGGNVSFYNETDGTGILPTPVIGVMGKVEGLENVCPSSFQKVGHLVFLLGETRAELGGSVYLQLQGAPLQGPIPSLDMRVEKILQEQLLAAIQAGLVRSAHDLSEGGLLFGLAESCLYDSLGLQAEMDSGKLRPDHFLLSESASRVVVSIHPDDETRFSRHFSDVPVTRVGVVTENRFELAVNRLPLISLPVRELRDVWESSFEEVFRN